MPRLVATGNLSPVDHVPEGVYVLGTPVPILQVVGVLPDVEPSTGVFPFMKGESWSGVDSTESERSGFTIVSILSASAHRLATLGGVTHLPPTTERFSSAAPRATAQPFQT